jgi:anti-sigma regulatory factor (Ser/Thr protein kinase)
MRELSDQQTYELSSRAPQLARRRLNEFIGLIESFLLDDLRIVTSELVSNAVAHSGKAGGDPITVKTRLASSVMRVEVIDYGERVVALPAHPHKRSGLGVIHEISDRWSAAAKTPFSVWAEIDVHTNGLVRLPPAPPI